MIKFLKNKSVNIMMKMISLKMIKINQIKKWMKQIKIKIIKIIKKKECKTSKIKIE
jgi:hypothetical protein